MAKFRMIISFYLTVAVMVSVALMPFAASSAEVDFTGGVFSVETSGAAEDASLLTQEEQSADTVPLNNEGEDIRSNVAPEREYSEKIMENSAIYRENSTFANSESSESTTATEELNTETNTEESQIFCDYEEEKENETLTAVTEPKTAGLHDSYSPSTTNEKIYDLYFLSSNFGSLENVNSVNTYTFLLESRSMFTFTVTHGDLTGFQGWNVSLYEEYYINGDGGEKGYRLITSLTTTAAAGKEKSPELGLSAGEYRLVVTSGGAYTSERYQIDVDYKDTSGYEMECNDNIFRYTEVYSSVPIKGSASYFTDRQDEDYYMFRMYEDGFVELKFSHPVVKDKITVCWQVIFFSEDGTEFYSVNSLFSDEVNYSGTIGLCEGNYFVLVRNRVYTDITYTLSISRTDDRSYEKEKNDTADTANKMSLNSTVIGSVSYKTSELDKDWFSFNIEKTGCVMIEFAHEPINDDSGKAGWNYVLTDSNGEILFSGVSLWSSDVVSSPEIGLGSGTYYICVDSEDLYHNSAEYYLLVNFSESDYWESEYNNTFKRADMIQADVPIYGFLAECGIDYDFDCYTFTLTEETDISVVFSHEALSYSKNIFTFMLCDVSGETVADSENRSVINVSADSESVTAVYKALSPGKYYIKVGTGQFFDLIRYSLCFSKGDTV